MTDPRGNLITVIITRLRQIPPERWALVGLALLVGGLWWGAWCVRPRPLEVIAFAVGDGDALLVRAPSGRAVLIDGGSRFARQAGERVLVPNLMLAGVRRLEAILISHPDADHINGLAAVIQALPVGMVLDPEIPSDGTEYQQVLEEARRRHVPCCRARVGGVVRLGNGVTLQVLAPGTRLLSARTPGEFTNDNSMVCLLSYHHARMLFTGDLSKAGEAALLARKFDLHADVLKVAHHGSRSGTSEDFLNAVRPTMALISCSGPGGPLHPEVLARLRAHSVQIYRTDISGELHATTDGEHWQIDPYRVTGTAN